MTLKATSVRLDENTLERIGQMAKVMDRPRAWLMAQAIKQFVEREEVYIKHVEEGIEAADAGKTITHETMKKKWESKRASYLD